MQKVISMEPKRLEPLLVHGPRQILFGHKSTMEADLQKNFLDRMSYLDNKWKELQEKFNSKKKKINDIVKEEVQLLQCCKLNSEMLLDLIDD